MLCSLHFINFISFLFVVKALRFLFNFYIDASIHVALAVYALFYLFIVKHNLPYSEALAYTIFYGTITGYNFVKYAPVAKLHHKSLTKNLRFIQLFSLINFVALIYYAVQLPIKTLSCFFLGTLIVFAYVFPVFKRRNLRSVGKLKIYLVAFSWTIAVVIAPVVHYNITLEYQLMLEVIQVFVLVVALIIPFDIRDLQYDNSILETIPQKIGVKQSKVTACLLLGVYLVIDVVLNNKTYYLVSLLVIALTCFTIYKMPNKPVKYYCSFGIESVPVLKLLLYLLFIVG